MGSWWEEACEYGSVCASVPTPFVLGRVVALWAVLVCLHPLC